MQPERSQSVEADVKGTDKTVTINEIGVNGLDQPYLQDGRIPSKAGEVAVTKKFLADSGLAVGDSLTVTPVDTGTATSTFRIRTPPTAARTARNRRTSKPMHRNRRRASRPN